MESAIPLFAAHLEDLGQVSFGVSQDGVETSDRLLEDVDAALEDVKNPFLNGPLDPEVEHLDGVRLADAVDATDPLLDAHRVPREVVVHKQMAELEVTPLAARFGAEQDARPRRCPETLDGSVFGAGFIWPWKR